MPNTKSAIKALRQNRRRRVTNRRRNSILRTTIKGFRKKLSSGDIEGARAELSNTYSKIDKGSKAGAIHPNTASRLKSRLSAALNRAVSI